MRAAPLIFRTNYFNRSWTWVKRGIVFGIICLVILLKVIDKDEPSPGYVLLAIAFFIVFSIPKDDLAVDNKYLYHVKKSIIPLFTRMNKYEISKIGSIKSQGTYSSEHEIIAFLSAGRLYQFTNAVQITFKDNSTTDFNVGIFKEDLDVVVATVKGLL